MNSGWEAEIVVDVDLQSISFVGIDGRKWRFVVAHKERSPVPAVLNI